MTKNGHLTVMTVVVPAGLLIDVLDCAVLSPVELALGTVTTTGVTLDGGGATVSVDGAIRSSSAST
jgi:hypothetical protein